MPYPLRHIRFSHVIKEIIVWVIQFWYSLLICSQLQNQAEIDCLPLKVVSTILILVLFFCMCKEYVSLGNKIP